MTILDHPVRESLAQEDSTTLVRRARQIQSRTMGSSISCALRAIASLAVRLTRPGMELMHLPWGSRSRSEKGNSEMDDAGQWISPKVPLVLRLLNQQTITCDVGTIWITHGDTNDYVLKAGQSLALRPAGSVIVTAMSAPALVRRTQQKSQPLVLKKEQAMSDLTLRERELVALGAAMGSNCAPCIEVHIPHARKAGLSDDQIAEAIQLADKVRQVPARKALNIALSLLPRASTVSPSPHGSHDCTGSSSLTSPGAACCP